MYYYGKKRQNYCKSTLRNKIAMVYSILNTQNIQRPKKIWTLKRYGRFWEQNVPYFSDKLFKESFRTDRNCFKRLVEMLPNLRKMNTTFRETIPLEKRIAIALYVLGSSTEYRKVGALFGVSKPTVCLILNEFCKGVWQALAPEYLPDNFLNQEKLEECVKGFDIIGFPQCFGAVDGCHIEMKPKTGEAFDYHNSEGWNSVVLFALVDYRCRFLYVNVGSPGRHNDSQIYETSDLKNVVSSTLLFKKNARKIGKTVVPVMLIGDSAFPFSETLMKPYPFETATSEEQKTFNNTLYKARRVVDNAFIHVKARFARIGKGLDNHPSNISTIIKCCCVLHNFLNTHNSKITRQWLVEAAKYNKPQPKYVTTIDDFKKTPERIRNSIAVHLNSALMDADETP
ncbi:putative nuclease HARBI1 [Teleopsis dalmanni]|uniref:putative nuclease HARBI1 n=1 Tax=Teleopsis dalmanni TaxID=139649 RepID=UPI0018CF46FB|nr:putative nuclease HARBI1 [Teleopsis dalmanni]